MKCIECGLALELHTLIQLRQCKEIVIVRRNAMRVLTENQEKEKRELIEFLKGEQ